MVQPDLIHRKRFAIAQDHRSLNHVLQLANVTGPMVRLKHFQSSLVDILDLLSDLACVALRKVFHQHGDVLFATSQRWHIDGKHIKPVKQVASEGSCVDSCLQVAVGGGDNTHVNGDGLIPADALKLALLQYTQQGNLRFGGKISDLVEEEGAAFRELETPQTPLCCTGESAFLVAEEFGSNQRRRYRCTIYTHEGSGGPWRPFVNGPGDQFLSSAGFSGDENRGVGRRNLCYLRQDAS